MADTISYEELLQVMKNAYGTDNQWANKRLLFDYEDMTSTEAIEAAFKKAGIDAVPDAVTYINGEKKVISWRYAAKQTHEVSDVFQNIGQAANSNNLPAAVNRTAEISTPVDVTFSRDGEKVVADVTTKELTTASGSKVLGAVSNVAAVVAAAQVGLSLGQEINKIMYEVNPDLTGGINPETIDYRDYYGKVGGTVFNFLMGTNPNGDGTSQGYLQEDDYAAIALKLWERGFFTAKNKWEYPSKELKRGDLLTLPPNKTYTMQEIADLITGIVGVKVNYVPGLNNNKPATDTIKFAALTGTFTIADNPSGYYSQLWGMQAGNGQYSSYRIGSGGNPPSFYHVVDGYGNPNGNYISAYGESIRVHYSEGVGYYLEAGGRGSNWGNIYYGSEFYYGYKKERDSDSLRIHFNTLDAVLGAHYATGVTKQPDSVLPDFSGIDPQSENPLEKVKQYLHDHFPALYDNSITQTVHNPDGTDKNKIWLPVPTPDAKIDDEPVSSEGMQTKPEVKIDDEPATQTILKIIKPTPPDTDTGDGDTPPVIIPTSAANALWSIYNPTLEQVKQFGGWLWSNDFIEQLKKMFQEPAQAIIGLHKIYGTPTTGGNSTIVVGYLDSGVPSKIVTKQYITIDCGSVSLPEKFGNVIDYTGTDISIFLPFVGVRQLSTADVMRSTISVKYHIDVLTGTGLAEISVRRDGAGGVLYQFTCDCAERFPISSGSYMGIVGGLIGVGAGIATAATGNLLMGGLMAAHAIGNSHFDVNRTGYFSGNAGAMGGKVPYLIISRAQPATANNFPAYVGKPANYTTTVGACKGFIKCIVDHLENIPATDSELSEIDTLLQQGILV